MEASEQAPAQISLAASELPARRARRYDQLVKVWDYRMMRQLNELAGHSGSVRTLAFYGDKLLSGSTDGTVRLWDFAAILRPGGATGEGDETAPPPEQGSPEYGANYGALKPSAEVSHI